MYRSARPAALFALALTLATILSLVFVPDAFAATAPAKAALAHFDWSHVGFASAIVAMRARVTDLETRAAAKLGEITQDLANEAVRTIEAEHAALLAELDVVRGQLEEAEAAERSAAPAPAPNSAAVIAAERTRQSEIRSLGARSGMAAADIDAACNRGDGVEAFRTRAFEFMATRADATMTRATAQFGGQDADETRRRGMSDAIAARLARAGGQRNVDVPEHARAFGEMGLVEIAAECIGHRGALRTPRQAIEVMERAFNTVSDFPGIFVDALNVRLLARYALAAPTYRLFAARYTTSDFKPTHVVRAGDFPSLQPVGETGEIKSGSFGESKEVIRVQPYAVMVNISRHMIVNDQLGAIDQMLGSTGERVTDWENAMVFGELKANRNLLADNKAVFHAGHNNLAAAGAKIGIESVGAGRAAMMKQTTIDGMKANFTPRTLLTGPDTQTGAEQLFAALTPALIGSAVPESFRRMLPASDANIDGPEWYLFADPAIAPCIHYGYLEGFEGPRLTSEQKFGVQGMSVKLEHDFGVASTDFRGGYKNPGAV